MDISQYLEIFIDETKEHLQSLNEHLLVLEKEPENTETINEIFRAAHSLKGMAGTMGFKRMQKLTHDMENVFQEIRSGNMSVKSKLVDILFRGLDALESYSKNIQETSDEGTNDYNEIIAGLNEVLEDGMGKSAVVEDKITAKKYMDVNNSGVSESKYLSITLADYEISAIRKVQEEGKNIFGITVYLQETCILKAARAFLVFKTLENKGELVKSAPSVEEIEDEEFDLDFSWIFATDDDMDEIKRRIENVSEIKEVVIAPYDIPTITESENNNEQEVLIAISNSNDIVHAEIGQNNNQTKKAPAKAGKVVANRSVRVDIEKLDILMNLVSELIIAKNGLVSISDSEMDSSQNSGFNEQIEYLERVTTNLHESVMKVRMVPIESVVNRFPRMMRDLCKKLDKKMELFMTGEETELDRTVIDEIGDPLMHLLRNAADHGLESNAQRVEEGKKEVGSVYLDAYQDGNNVVIEVRDDGGGIHVEKIKKKAVEKGVITQEQADNLTKKEAIDILFRPSFSMAEVISDVSGRGVGLDVVKTKIESLGGNIEARTEIGVGSTFIIRLPLTLAIIQALMVVVGKEKYAIPLGNIQTIEDVDQSEIKFIQSTEVIHLRGNVIPIIRLEDILDVEPLEEKPQNLTIVIVKKGDKQAGLVIDELIGQQEIVIKSIGQYINNNKMIGGATILGDGEVALILEVNALV